MIIWLASYPKSGNTWLRAMIASYFYTNDGIFDFNVLEQIDQFPSYTHFEHYNDKFERPESTTKYWFDAQTNINKDKKLKFLKTHNALCKIEDNEFTDKRNTLGAIYIIRDPRNVLTSVANHFDKNIGQALEFMTDEKRCLIHKDKDRYLGFIPLFTWAQHQKSWVKTKRFPILTIRYEDLQTQTFEVFKNVLDFIKSISNFTTPFDKEKVKKVVQSCDFYQMQKLEKKQGFRESVMTKDKSNNINFFNLGPSNNYRELLDSKTITEMNNLFQNQLKEFNYD